MAQKIQSIQVTVVAGSALGMALFLLGEKPVQAFGFQDTNAGQIEMLDATGAIVGSGSFTYSPFVGRFVGERTGLQNVLYEDPSHPFARPPIGPTGSTYRPPTGYSMVTSLAVNLNLGGTNYWLPGFYRPPTRTGNSIVGQSLFFFNAPSTDTLPSASNDLFLTVLGGDPRSGTLSTRDDVWFGCLPACGGLQQQTFALNSNGSWSFGGSASGTFRMSTLANNNTTAVPEPTTITGLAIAGGLGWWAKRRQNRHRSAA